MCVCVCVCVCVSPRKTEVRGTIISGGLEQVKEAKFVRYIDYASFLLAFLRVSFLVVKEISLPKQAKKDSS
jgi:hypothetical protein